jgi:hypothetical protein
MERDFKGVWIPKDIWLNEDLGWTEKLLLVEIDSLAKNGECFASNEYFAKFFGLSKDRISKMITSLNRKGLLEVNLVYKEGSKQVDKRIIKVNPIGENAHTPRRKRLDPLGENAYTPLGENAEDNNTSFINTINNTSNKRNIGEKSLEKEFELLWKIYPRKMGKKKAFDSFKKARKVKKVPYEIIENGLYRYLRHIEDQGLEEQYIQHGSTWFNQEKWQDEYITTGINKKPKNALEYYRQQYGEENNHGFTRNETIIDYYSEVVPELF